MCAYNAAYGIPSCASPLTDLVLRQQWGWDGFVISDCDAISMIMSTHNYTHTPFDTVKAVSVAGFPCLHAIYRISLSSSPSLPRLDPPTHTHPSTSHPTPSLCAHF